ncbi:hypothetical protein DSM14862_03512 (plasmid) [Sulfitobacter indolifex]|uniref:hypothetical protein n=1 Tax=Sulfitobacter indolifex TaxID=225422 RepID=UPI001FACB575|nr:hypothetical protein [Sulfitobacter indolifex]UOA20674.1 hypothetical protein DSM14862_03512 [Sulfitobacter indolifex]
MFWLFYSLPLAQGGDFVIRPSPDDGHIDLEEMMIIVVIKGEGCFFNLAETLRAELDPKGAKSSASHDPCLSVVAPVHARCADVARYRRLLGWGGGDTQKIQFNPKHSRYCPLLWLG